MPLQLNEELVGETLPTTWLQGGSRNVSDSEFIVLSSPPSPMVPVSEFALRRSERAVPQRCMTIDNLASASLTQVRRNLTRAWRHLFAMRIVEAIQLVDQIDIQVDDLAPEVVRTFHAATQMVRAAAHAFQDDSLAALAMAAPHLKGKLVGRQYHPALTICRMGFWQLGDFDALHALPRHAPESRCAKSRSIAILLDRSIEAAAALDRLLLPIAKSLSLDAMKWATSINAPPGLEALPACLYAQILYEEGQLEEAEAIVKSRITSIKSQGSIECGLRGYLLLARIARQRMHYDLAAIILREAEAHGEHRGWPRLVAACMEERISLLLEVGKTREAKGCIDYLDSYAEKHRTGAGYPRFEIVRHQTIARCRVSWQESPSREAVVAIRQLYNQSVERGEFYVACRLSVELSKMLFAIGESERADALFLQALRSAATAGLYQPFLESRDSSEPLLQRAHFYVNANDNSDRDILPLLSFLIARRNTWRPNHAVQEAPRSISDVLTKREREILQNISEGLSNKGIAKLLNISPETVKSHIKRLFVKLGTSARAEAVSKGKSLGFF
jgi:ATP/maltotriose-dependent transcriptional regulator MalT